jgi:hypothetical protein
VPGYTCAARAHEPDTRDPARPIVLLVHGNASTPRDWEICRAGDGSAPVTAMGVTGYFYAGLLPHHFGAVRSAAALEAIVAALER